MKRYNLLGSHLSIDMQIEEDGEGDFIYYSDHLEVVEDLNAKIKLLVDHIEFMNEKMDQLKDLL
jgi:hypothetical protein